VKIFVVGATGFVGGAVAKHLVEIGHIVSGVARSEERAVQLRRDGITPISGDLESAPEGVVSSVRTAEAVIFAPQLRPETEFAAGSAILAAMENTQKTFLFMSGSGVFLQRTGGAWSQDSFAEDDDFVAEPLAARRVEVENLVRRAPSRGVRGIVLRPPLIWGPGDHGHVAMTYRSVALTGAACYIGEGLATFSNVHIDDLVSLCARVLVGGEPGALYHAVGGEIPNRWIAEAVARDMRCKTRSVSMAESAQIWGEFGSLIMGASSRSRSPRSREQLGWIAKKTDMLTMIGEPRLRALAARDTNQRR
jgi:nucleoside-diphosphate-sugar epimerase